MTPSGGTHYAENLHKYVERLLASRDNSSSGEKSIRILFALTDEDVDAQQQAQVNRTIEQAEEEGAHVFIIPLGNISQVKASQNTNNQHPYRVIAPDSFGDYPAAVMDSFANSIRPPAIGASWLDTVDAAMLGQAKVKIGDPKPIKGYKHFFTQEIGGYEFLKFQRPGQEAKYWQRGFGGAYVPKTKVLDIVPNEDKIIQILDILYRPNHVESSYSPDGLWGLRLIEDGKIEIVKRVGQDGGYTPLAVFDPRSIGTHQEGLDALIDLIPEHGDVNDWVIPNVEFTGNNIKT